MAADEGRTRHATRVQPDFRGKSQEPMGPQAAAGAHNRTQVMPNIDTPGRPRAGRTPGGARMCWDARGRRRPGCRRPMGNFYTVAGRPTPRRGVVVVDGRITFVGKPLMRCDARQLREHPEPGVFVAAAGVGGQGPMYRAAMYCCSTPATRRRWQPFPPASTLASAALALAPVSETTRHLFATA